MAQLREFTSFSRIEYDGLKGIMPDPATALKDSKIIGLNKFHEYLATNKEKVLERTVSWTNLRVVRVYRSAEDTFSFEFVTYLDPVKLLQEEKKRQRERAPRPPAELVGALQDRIHPTSGRLINAKVQPKPANNYHKRRETFLRTQPSGAAYEAAFRQRKQQAREDFHEKVKVEKKTEAPAPRIVESGKVRIKLSLSKAIKNGPQNSRT